ncbi:MAG TPA: DUF58 domain-containing protein [Rudaea sp.]|jgi:uncharacterized protein (DUF58 family)|nr:DUF58 domain-containing protein [Rudaea sp.]
MSATQVSLDELIAMRLRARRFARPARRVSGNRSATHGSRFRGRGVDYVESREYQPGDDIRQMDWRVTARSGRPHTKLFQEEREQSILLIVDTNPSMRFGTRARFKSVQAARSAALLAWASVQSGDRVGAVAFGSGFIGEVKPNGGPRGALRVLRALAEWDAVAARGGDAISLSQALQRARRLARPGSRVILLSDGFSADAAAEGPLSLLAEHCDVAAILMSDPLEQIAPPPARYAVQGDGGKVMLDFTEAPLRTRWPQLFAERREAAIQMLKRRALRWAMLDTRSEPESALPRILGMDRRASDLVAKTA